MPEQGKRCSTCKTDKSLAEFHRNKARKDGVASECKSCWRLGRTDLGRQQKVARKEGLESFRELEYRLCQVCSAQKSKTDFLTSAGNERDHRSTCNTCMNSKRRPRSTKTKTLLRAGPSSSYIRGLLSRGAASAADIPESLVAVKALQIQIIRLAKDIENEKR